jgi:hypothetical protein
VRIRPQPDVWSALEYTAHLRDAIAFYEQRIDRVVTEDGPTLTAFGFAAACEERRYNDENPEVTLAGLEAAATRLAARLEGLAADKWARSGIGSEGGERSVLVLARRGAHECRHHALDIARVLERVTA